MTIIIFGANGKVGRLVVAGLVKKHKIIAVIHNNDRFIPDDKNITKIKFNQLSKNNSLVKTLKNCDVVISLVSSWKSKNTAVLTNTMSLVIPAMKEAHVSRIISLTGADARLNNDALSLTHKITHTLISILNKKVLADSESHLKLLQNSDLDWTVIRSPVMLNISISKKYTLTNVRTKPWQTINRIYVALAIIDQVKNDNFIKGAPYIKE